MNKKVIIAIVAVVLVVAIGAGVWFFALNGGSAPKVEVADSADVVNKVLVTYSEKQKFPSMGGGISTAVDGKAGLMDMSDTESINGLIHTDDALLSQVDEVASYVHAMLANNFTCGSFKLKDAKNADDFASSLEEKITSTQWICGTPEKLVVFNVNGGDYIVYAVGSADLIEYFKTQFTATYNESAVLITESAIA